MMDTLEKDKTHLIIKWDKKNKEYSLYFAGPSITIEELADLLSDVMTEMAHQTDENGVIIPSVPTPEEKDGTPPWLLGNKKEDED